MVGEGVMQECIESPLVKEIVLLNRRASGHHHSKIREIICTDLMNTAEVQSQLTGLDACFFCLGISSVGKKEDEYTRTTYELTISIAKTLINQNPQMQFHYISGAGTDSSEKGKSMWAKVKGMTENKLMQMGFSKCFRWRPGILLPDKPLKNTLKYYHYVGPLLRFIMFIIPASGSKLSVLGKAMIAACSLELEDQKCYEVKDIRKTSQLLEA